MPKELVILSGHRSTTAGKEPLPGRPLSPRPPGVQPLHNPLDLRDTPLWRGLTYSLVRLRVRTAGLFPTPASSVWRDEKGWETLHG